MPQYFTLSDAPPSWQSITATEIVPIPTDKHALPVCVVTGVVTVGVPDLISDPDKVPEAEKLNGTGVIKATGNIPFLAPHFPSGPITILPGDVDFQVVNGVFTHNGTPGVAVLAGDIFTLPVSVAYTIELDVQDANGDDVVFPPVAFAATQGTVDYTMLQGI